MRVSVVLCTRDGARYVEEQVRSILAQTHPIHELVVGDDASTDETIAIVERLASEAGVPLEIRRHDPPLGVAANFADAIARATGDVVALSDQDDVWHPDRIARLVPALDGVHLVHTDARIVDGDGRPTGATLLESLEASRWELAQMEGGDAFAALLRRNLVTGATVVVRRDAALAALPVPVGWIHDEWLAMVCALQGGVRLVPDQTIDYRQHGANQIGVQRLTLRLKLLRLVADDAGAHERKAIRAASLAVEAARRGYGSPEQRELLREKARHERVRADLPPRRILRARRVVDEALSGRYRIYARGLLDIARDLMEGRRA